jgi:Secretion system C-terminal sorting domain
LDNKAKFSEIRSVRGDGQLGKTIVYPNPTADGKVNIVFEDKNVTRDIAVSDMSGRIIKQMKSVTNNNIIIDNLTPGMYSIRIVAVETGEQIVEKVIVNKR